jgi:hypothetical protein
VRDRDGQCWADHLPVRQGGATPARRGCAQAAARRSPSSHRPYSSASRSAVALSSAASDSVLSDRLTELATAGLVHRVVAEGPPVAVRYELTDSGTKLVPALRELARWADDNLEATAPTA